MNAADGIYQVMPPLSPEEYEALKADIGANGVLVAIVKDQHGNVLDGHHRMQIAEELGIEYRVDIVIVEGEDQARTLARTYNLARRHLSREQKRKLIADEITADPDRSDRAIARLMGVDHKTVGSVRRELRGELPHPRPESASVLSDRDLSEMLVNVIVQRYDAAQTDEERRAWAVPLQCTDEILAWGVSSSHLVYFAAIARTLYAVEAHPDVWEGLAPWLTAVAAAALEDAREVREALPEARELLGVPAVDDDGRKLPGERLAEVTVALWSPHVTRGIREAMLGSDVMQGQIATGIAECAGWWPIPDVDTVPAGAARVLREVALRDAA